MNAVIPAAVARRFMGRMLAETVAPAATAPRPYSWGNSTMPGQNPAIDMASIEAISVVFAAVMVWLSALVQNVSDVARRGS
jgi:hypothetical protein